MKRRTFIQNASGLLLLSHPVLSWAVTDEEIISGYHTKETRNKCQSVNKSESAAAVHEVNPNSEPGLLLPSIGCRYPHKHFLFIPQRYFLTPDLLTSEADTRTAAGVPAKTFWTSHSFDMSDQGLAEVGVHQHLLTLTLPEMEIILGQDSGLEKIAYLRPTQGALIPGHIFHLVRAASANPI